MIVLGADTHKRSHTIAAVAAVTGELLGEQTVAVGRRGFDGLLRWARGLDGERVWAAHQDAAERASSRLARLALAPPLRCCCGGGREAMGAPHVS